MKKTIRDPFLTAKEKSANDYELAKLMVDNCDAMLRTDADRIWKINECWHLHNARWPEMDIYLGLSDEVMSNKDGEGRPFNQNDFIVHHPKINNISSYVLGEMITQPLIPIVRDFSARGRKFREEARLQKTLGNYKDEILGPLQELIRQQYMQDSGIIDMLSLTPEEQRQAQNELQARMKAGIPRSMMDDLKKIKTPDEKIKKALIDFDMKAYHIEEKFQLGAEQALIAYEEYYLLLMKGFTPTISALNAKNVRWLGPETCDYSEDGDMAAVDTYHSTQSFIAKWGREVIKKKNFMKDMEQYFTEVPGYHRQGAIGHGREDTPLFIEAERDFVDMLGENPNLIQNDWRTRMGQQEIAGLYGSLNGFAKPGYGIKETYTTFKWSETVTYVQREELDDNNKKVINEYFFSADYAKDKSKDIMCRKYPINRVYHGTKIANKFYAGVEPVAWQFFGGARDFTPKLTICGRRYANSNGNDEETTWMGPGIQYQLRYNISASKLEELERRDFGSQVFWNADLRPEGWSEEDYIDSMMKHGNTPYTRAKATPGQKQTDAPAIVIQSGANANMEKYHKSMDMWENEMYKALKVNRDALGLANPYQSNQQTQSNKEGASKQLLPFFNKRRLLKQRVLNYYSNMSMMGLIEDKEKQMILLDDFSRIYLNVNADDLKANDTAIFIVDDWGEAQNARDIKAQAVSILQQTGASLLTFIETMDSKSVQEMKEIAEISDLQRKEDASDAHAQRMAELQQQEKTMMAAAKYQADRADALEQRKSQVDLMLGEMDSMTMENAADVDKDKIADSIQRTAMEIASQEKIAREKNETDLKKEQIKGKSKSVGKPPR